MEKKIAFPVFTKTDLCARACYGCVLYKCFDYSLSGLQGMLKKTTGVGTQTQFLQKRHYVKFWQIIILNFSMHSTLSSSSSSIS